MGEAEGDIQVKVDIGQLDMEGGINSDTLSF